MSSLRMDFEKEGISIRIDWDWKILNKNGFRKRKDLKISIFEITIYRKGGDGFLSVKFHNFLKRMDST